MGLKGKLVSQTRVKYEGDLFQLFKFPHQIPQLTPHLVHSVDLMAGHWGTPGSVIQWTYNQDGVMSVSTDIVEGIDEKKKSITFKIVGGDLLKLYDSGRVIIDVESNGEDNMLTWTVEYEKSSEAVPDPTAFMNFLLNFSRDMQLVPN